MGADYLFYVNFIAIRAPTFFGHIISVLARVNTVPNIASNDTISILPIILKCKFAKKVNKKNHIPSNSASRSSIVTSGDSDLGGDGGVCSDLV